MQVKQDKIVESLQITNQQRIFLKQAQDDEGFIWIKGEGEGSTRWIKIFDNI